MSTTMELPGWTQFKAVCITSKKLACQFTESTDRYELFGPDGDFLWRTTLLKGPVVDEVAQKSPEQIEFETTYKAVFNGPLSQVDSDGAVMSRAKVAPSGWSFQLHGIEMQSSTLGIINCDYLGNPIGDSIVTLYDAQGQVITTQESADTDCVRTVMDFEPPYDYYVVGGAIKVVTPADQDIRVYVVGAPDIPAQFGGSKLFIQHVNLRFTQGEGIHADGRAAKFVQYNAQLHTNKLRFLFTHAPGYKLKLALFLEFFKA